MNSQRTESGWTAEEYAKCPEVINRLHSRILDLQDALQRFQDALERIASTDYRGHRSQESVIAYRALHPDAR